MDPICKRSRTPKGGLLLFGNCTLYKNARFWEKKLRKNLFRNNNHIPKHSLGLGITETLLGKGSWFKLQLNQEFTTFLKIIFNLIYMELIVILFD